MEDEKKRPVFYMLAGPNGAGKSTLYNVAVAPETNAPFINADLIKAKELPGSGKEGDYRAADLAKERRADQVREGISFVSESTFSHPSKVDEIKHAKDSGFTVHLYHISLESAEKAIQRVGKRVGEGGHDVPDDKVRGRYERNPQFIREAALISDVAQVFDNSKDGQLPERILEMRDGKIVSASPSPPKWVSDTYKPDLEKWNSLREAQAHLLANHGYKFKLRLASTEPGAKYQGEVVHESPHHAIQATLKKFGKLGVVVAHDKADLKTIPEVGRNVVIQYKAGEPATVRELSKSPDLSSKDRER